MYLGRDQTPSNNKTGPWLKPMLVSALASFWLLSTRILPRIVENFAGEIGYLLFLGLAIPVFVAVFLKSVVGLAHSLITRNHRLLAILPLLINVLALALFYFAPISRPLDDLDFVLHRAAREEVVSRVESGELWDGSPHVSVAFLPREYLTSVSGGSGQRSLVVYREENALHVVFFLRSGFHNEHSAFLYRSDRRSPSLSSRYLHDAVSSERLDDRWHRVTFSHPSAIPDVMLTLIGPAIGVLILLPLASVILYFRCRYPLHHIDPMAKPRQRS